MIKIAFIPLFCFSLHVLYVCIALVFPKIIHRGKTEIKRMPRTRYSVEHIVCFKNESPFIKKKLDNTCQVDSFHTVHHTFVNDCSTDDTLQLLEQYQSENSTVISNSTNLGKNQSQIKVVNSTRSDFLLFTDANVFVTGETIDKLIDAFDEDTGGVTGNVRVTTDFERQDLSGRYWEFEKRIKEFQTLFGSVIGFDGGLYCVKRENYNLSRENELSDFETAFLIFEQGKKTKYVKDALAVELEKRTIKNTLKSRIRACNRVFWSFFRIFKYVKRLQPVVIAHFAFHKLIRYLSSITFILFLPVIVIALFNISAFLVLIFFIPHVLRIILECLALCIGGIVALTGTEYKSWSQKKI